jgi:hypothetical protein
VLEHVFQVTAEWKRRRDERGEEMLIKETEGMKCPKCHFEQGAENAECIRCGLIFSKYNTPGGSQPEQKPQKTMDNSIDESPEAYRFFPRMKELLFYVEPDVNVFYFAGRVALFAVILFYGFKFIFSPMEKCYGIMPFMHLVNLPFHEAGHIIFMAFGKFIMFLGGTLGQLLMPLICLIALLLTTRDTFGASASLWWFGQNFIDIAPYINDARALKLILLGGVTGRETDGHDWENILRTMDWLRYDHMIAKMAYSVGAILMVLASVWGGYILCRQYQNVEFR